MSRESACEELAHLLAREQADRVDLVPSRDLARLDDKTRCDDRFLGAARAEAGNRCPTVPVQLSTRNDDALAALGDQLDARDRARVERHVDLERARALRLREAELDELRRCIGLVRCPRTVEI